MREVTPSTAANLPSVNLDVLRSEISAAHMECERSLKAGLENAARVGELLAVAKEAIPHGQWETWVGENCEFSLRTAQTYMRVNRELPAVSKAQRSALLSIKSAIEVLAEPKPIEIPRTTPRRQNKPRALDQAVGVSHETEEAGETDETGQIEDAHDSPAEVDPIEDDLKTLIPGWVKEFDQLIRGYTALLKEAERLSQIAGSGHLDANRIDELTAKTRACQAVLKSCKPHSVCPYCEAELPKGATCKACDGLGYVTKVIAESAPR